MFAASKPSQKTKRMLTDPSAQSSPLHLSRNAHLLHFFAYVERRTYHCKVVAVECEPSISLTARHNLACYNVFAIGIYEYFVP